MDLVYNRSEHPIGLLYHPTISMAELELLAGLMTMQFGKCGPEFKLPPGLSPESACRTLELLEAIVRDVWWTRAWIYQENYRGGMDMKLLIPHCVSSEDYRDDHVRLFKDIPGEIVLDSIKFHEAATAFCLAFDTPPPSLIKAKELVLERARKYTLLLEKPGPHDRDLATRSMSPLIIADIEKRQLTLPMDRLPIIANCCQYFVRLDSEKLAEENHSVGLAILALFLLNGEILYNGRDNELLFSGAQNMTNFLNVQAFNRYSPPQSTYGLTYNKSCRFIDVELTKYGTRTKGHLWKLGRYINTSKFHNTPPFVKGNGNLTRDERRELGLLADELDSRNLSEEIYKYLDYSDTSDYRNSFAKEYQYHMAKELAAAVSEGRLLRLAVLWDPSHRYSPYRGIFISNQSEANTSLEYVFTASREKEADNDRHLPNDIDRHVSLEIDCTFDDGRPPFLYTRRWIHGLCFFYGCPRIEVIFPWPSTIEQV